MTNSLPTIKLEEGEEIVLTIKRSGLTLVALWAGEALALILLIVLSIFLVNSALFDHLFHIADSTRPILFFILFLLGGILLLVGLVSTAVYRKNILYVTNKRLIQNVCNSLLSNSTNVINLGSVEDVSFHRSGLLDYLLHIGTIRFATVGDETTYTFKYVDTPQDEMETITHLVHEAKKDKKS